MLQAFATNGLEYIIQNMIHPTYNVSGLWTHVHTLQLCHRTQHPNESQTISLWKVSIFGIIQYKPLQKLLDEYRLTRGQ